MTAGLGDFANIDADKVLKKAREQAEKMAGAQEKILKIEGEAQSRDGYVKATYSATDGLRDLELNPRAMRMPSTDLAQTIKETVREAANNMQQKIQEAMASAFGDNNPMDMINNQEKAMAEAKQAQELLNKTISDTTAAFDEMRRRLDL